LVGGAKLHCYPCTLVPNYPRHFGTGEEVSNGHFGTNTKMCRNVVGPKCPYTSLVISWSWPILQSEELAYLNCCKNR